MEKGKKFCRVGEAFKVAMLELAAQQQGAQPSTSEAIDPLVLLLPLPKSSGKIQKLLESARKPPISMELSYSSGMSSSDLSSLSEYESSSPSINEWEEEVDIKTAIGLYPPIDKSRDTENLKEKITSEEEIDDLDYTPLDLSLYALNELRKRVYERHFNQDIFTAARFPSVST